MGNNIQPNNRTAFFPQDNRQKPTQIPPSSLASVPLRNTDDRSLELKEKTKKDAKVDIQDAIKDFSRIKKIADNAPEIDKSEKINQLKESIQNGDYSIDYDALADKMIQDF